MEWRLRSPDLIYSARRAGAAALERAEVTAAVNKAVVAVVGDATAGDEYLECFRSLSEISGAELRDTADAVE